jgi:hypothetical protein
MFFIPPSFDLPLFASNHPLFDQLRLQAPDVILVDLLVVLILSGMVSLVDALWVLIKLMGVADGGLYGLMAQQLSRHAMAFLCHEGRLQVSLAQVCRISGFRLSHGWHQTPPG